MRSLGCGWTSDSAATDLNPDITGRKCRFRADPIPIDELPFTAEDLVAEGVISDVSDLNCASTLFADAGDDQTADTGREVVTLDGSGSNPAGGTFAWVLAVPEGSTTAALSDPTIVNPRFTPDVDGTYTVTLTYTVGEESDTDTVDVVAVTNPVIANAGEDQEVRVDESVTLNGSGTPDGGSFFWFLKEPPFSGSAAELSGRDTATPTFTPDVPGRYTVVLIYLFDGADARDQVLINATEGPGL